MPLPKFNHRHRRLVIKFGVQYRRITFLSEIVRLLNQALWSDAPRRAVDGQINRIGGREKQRNYLYARKEDEKVGADDFMVGRVIINVHAWWKSESDC